MKLFLLVGLGGAIGSMLRYAVQKLFSLQQNLNSFPVGTFLVNIFGCFLIGLFWSYYTKTTNENDDMKLLLMTGLCGGFTTFSAFTLEGIGLLKANKTGIFFLYAGGSVLLGLLATLFGIRILK